PSSYSYLTIIFFFNSTPTPETYTLSLHDALPISKEPKPCLRWKIFIYPTSLSAVHVRLLHVKKDCSRLRTFYSNSSPEILNHFPNNLSTKKLVFITRKKL